MLHRHAAPGLLSSSTLARGRMPRQPRLITRRSRARNRVGSVGELELPLSSGRLDFQCTVHHLITCKKNSTHSVVSTPIALAIADEIVRALLSPVAFPV